MARELDVFAILDRVSPSFGSILRYHMAKLLGADPLEVMYRSPSAFYEAMCEALGSKEACDYTLRVLAEEISSEEGVSVDPDLLISALKGGVSDTLRWILSGSSVDRKRLRAFSSERTRRKSRL